MHDWKLRKNDKHKKMSSTPGKSKPTCICTPLQKTVTRRSRSWKWPCYETVMSQIDRRAGGIISK